MTRRTVDAILDRDYLEIRTRLLDLAAALDRVDRAREAAPNGPDRRIAQIRTALEALCVPEPDRAETVQHIFSLEYDPNWMSNLGVGRDRAGKH